MEISFYATLRDVVGDKSVYVDDAPSMTVGRMLHEVLTAHPALRVKLLDERGELHTHIHILVNGRDVRFLDGLETIVAPQDSVRIFPPVGGG
jgi:molybdopterin synthase sulfur carrier subunit